MIQEPFRDDVIRTPLKVYGPALPGAQEWNPTSLKGLQGIGCSRGGHPLADDDGSGSGPGEVLQWLPERSLRMPGRPRRAGPRAG